MSNYQAIVSMSLADLAGLLIELAMHGTYRGIEFDRLFCVKEIDACADHDGNIVCDDNRIIGCVVAWLQRERTK